MKMVSYRRIMGKIVALFMVVAGLGCLGNVALAAEDKLEGSYVRLDEPSTHKRGKVQLIEFADFYCPHCHMFEQTAIPFLAKEFGDKVEVTMVGFPVIPGMLPTAFLMYEVAKTMGKGQEMKEALFRTIHKDRVAILDRTIRGLLIREVGLDQVKFEQALMEKGPAEDFEVGKRWGQRIQVDSTPTVLLDGNIKIAGGNLNPQNLKTVIQSILDNDSK